MTHDRKESLSSGELRNEHLKKLTTRYMPLGTTEAECDQPGYFEFEPGERLPRIRGCLPHTSVRADSMFASTRGQPAPIPVNACLPIGVSTSRPE